jgi:signal transduction histidine kinase
VADSDERDRYYRIVTAESERLSHLIDNVLELARLERNPRAMSLSLGDVTGVVRETLEVLEPHASELAFELRFEAAPDLPALAFDRDALSQVLFDLVDNALEYSSDAKDRFVSIRCERQGQGVVLRVADRGPGVAPEQQRRARADAQAPRQPASACLWVPRQGRNQELSGPALDGRTPAPY